MNTEELIKRLEAATGPDRILDAEIAVAVGVATGFKKLEGWREPALIYRDDAANPTAYPLPYTENIDAALTLVPEGWWVKLTMCRNKSAPHVHHCELDRDADIADCDLDNGEPLDIDVQNVRSNPAIAICIAALKAVSK